MRRLILLLLPLFLFSACSRTHTRATDALADYVSMVAASPPAHVVYAPDGTPADTLAEHLYGTDSTLFDTLADYAILLGCGTDLYEIHILRVRNLADRSRVSEALHNRADLLCLATEEGHPTVPAAVVAEQGTTIFLFATPYNAIFLSARTAL